MKNINLKRIILFLFSLFVVVPLYAGQDSTSVRFSMEQAINYALEHNPVIRNAQYDIQIAKKKVWETTAIGLPQVSGSILYKNIFKVPSMNFPVSYMVGMPVYNTADDPNSGINYYQYYMDTMSNYVNFGVKEQLTYTLSVNQLIFSGEYLVGLQAARTYKQLSADNLVKQTIEIKDLVTQTYLLILMNTENKKIIDSSRVNMEKLLHETTEMFKQGFVEETDVEQLQITVSGLKDASAEMAKQLHTSRQLLKIQMGMALTDSLMLTDQLATLFQQTDYHAAVMSGYDIKNNIDYRLMLTQVKLARLSLKREQSKILPSIAAFYQHQEFNRTPKFNFNFPNMLGVQLQWNIFTSGSRWSKIRQAKLEYEKSLNNQSQAEKNIQLAIMQAKSQLQTATRKYNTEKASLSLSGKIYQRTLEKYKAGTAGSFDLLQAHNQYLTHQGNMVAAMFKILSANSKLNKLLNQ